jgi:hypothetical protein
MTEFYRTDPDDPDAPVALEERNGIKPGDHVTYENPSWRGPDGGYLTGGMDPPLIVDALYELDPLGEAGGMPTAIINGGEYEVCADHLRKEERGETHSIDIRAYGPQCPNPDPSRQCWCCGFSIGALRCCDGQHCICTTCARAEGEKWRAAHPRRSQRGTKA